MNIRAAERAKIHRWPLRKIGPAPATRSQRFVRAHGLGLRYFSGRVVLLGPEKAGADVVFRLMQTRVVHRDLLGNDRRPAESIGIEAHVYRGILAVGAGIGVRGLELASLRIFRT